MRYAYVNGRFLPHAGAMVHIEDRGYQFGDGVYEVTPVAERVLIDEAAHLDRLDRSLRELRIAWPAPRRAVVMLQRDLVARNRLGNGFLYLQVTRGVAPRDHKFPAAAKPALVMTTRWSKPWSEAEIEKGVAVTSLPERRWKRCDIKSINLLANVLGKQAAAEAGAFESWQVDALGQVTEGTSSNAWIVTREGEIVTRPLGEEILAGITRAVALDLARGAALRFAERAFSLAEAFAASEAFLTSSTNQAIAVTRIDGRPIGAGKAGPVLLELRRRFAAHVTAEIAAARAA